MEKSKLLATLVGDVRSYIVSVVVGSVCVFLLAVAKTASRPYGTAIAVAIGLGVFMVASVSIAAFWHLRETLRRRASERERTPQELAALIDSWVKSMGYYVKDANHGRGANEFLMHTHDPIANRHVGIRQAKGSPLIEFGVNIGLGSEIYRKIPALKNTLPLHLLPMGVQFTLTETRDDGLVVALKHHVPASALQNHLDLFQAMGVVERGIAMFYIIRDQLMESPS